MTVKEISRRAAVLGGVGSAMAGSTLLSACKNYKIDRSAGFGRDDETWVAASAMDWILPPEWPIAAKPKTLAVEEGELWFLDSEKGEETILLLHAFTGSARSWAYQFPTFLKAGYRVIAPSIRGAYGTTAPMDVMHQQIEDIRGLVSHLNLSKFHLLGTAYGAMLALRYALANIEQLKTITLSCSLCGLGEPSYQKRQRILLQPEFVALPEEIKELGASYRHSNPDGTARWKKLVKESGATKLKSLEEEHRSKIIRSVLDGGPSYANISDLKLPIQLIFGGADLYAPPSAARLLQENFGNSSLTFIQETGHSAFWEQPNVFNATVVDFLNANLK